MMMGPQAAMLWLYRHEVEVDRFLRDRFHPDDYEYYLDQIYQYPVLAQMAISDSALPNPEKVKKVLDYLLAGSKIIMVIGSRGGGKTCTVHYLLKLLVSQGGRDVYFIGPPMDIDDSFKHSYDIYSTPEGTINVIDESALLANARKSSKDSNLSLTAILPTLRHVDKTIIVVTQNSALTDLNFIRLADAHIIKKFSFMQDQTERENLFGKQLEFFMPRPTDSKGVTFFYSDSFLTRFHHSPGDGWNDRLSKCYRHIENEDEAVAYARSLLSQNYEVKEIRDLLRVKGFDRDLEYYAGLA